MPEDSPFKPSWWYRTEFAVPAGLAGRTLWLHFDGINYRANVWVNGTQDRRRKGGRGRIPPLRVRRDPPSSVPDERERPRGGGLRTRAHTTSPSCGWTGTRRPPTRTWGSGATSTSPTAAPSPCATPTWSRRSTSPPSRPAQLTVTAEVWNATDRPVSGIVRGAIEAIRFSKAREPRARANGRPCASRPQEVPALTVKNPRIWWPYRMGRPEPVHARPRRRGGRRRSPTGRRSASASSR